MSGRRLSHADFSAAMPSRYVPRTTYRNLQVAGRWPGEGEEHGVVWFDRNDNVQIDLLHTAYQHTAYQWVCKPIACPRCLPVRRGRDLVASVCGRAYGATPAAIPVVDQSAIAGRGCGRAVGGLVVTVKL